MNFYIGLIKQNLTINYIKGKLEHVTTKKNRNSPYSYFP